VRRRGQPVTRKTRDSGTFGTAHKLPSGRYRAMYYGPDGRRYTAATTFTSKHEARAWLATQQVDIIRKAWQPPEPRAKTTKVTFAAYAEQWRAHRQLKDRTREHYWLLDEHLIPAFGSRPLAAITSDEVRSWHAGVRRRHTHRPIARLQPAAQHHGHRCE